MLETRNPQDRSQDGAPMVGDHLAMDLLNTQARSGDAMVEHWETGGDVLGWLGRYGIVPPHGSAPVAEDELLAQAHALREVVRAAVTQRKRGERIDAGALNSYLDGHITSPRLLLAADGKLVLVRVPQGGIVPFLLGSVAQAAAELLIEGDFDLVRQCEHPECVLWFYDRTKAHKRRWCSMALCGNRHKAAQFRKRNNEAAGEAAL